MNATENLPFLRPDREVGAVPVQNTTFSVDGVARYICNTWEEATGAVLKVNLEQASGHFDAIVIGSGMYGAYAAEQMWRRGLKVLVLEAGPFLFSEHTQNLARLGIFNPSAVLPNSGDGRSTRNLVWGIPWSGNQVFNGLAFCVGGKSLFWGGWSPRLTDDVLSRRPSAARPGFTPTLETYLKETYERVEIQLGVREQRPGKPSEVETDFIDETGSNGLTRILRGIVDGAVPGITGLAKSERAPLAVQGRSPSSGLFSFDKYSSGPLLIDALREDAELSKNDDASRRLFLVPRCRVTRLDAENGIIKRIHVIANGEQKSLDLSRTSNVLLAGSCIESTRLALESFPNRLMGRNLMVHIRSNLAIRVPRKKFTGLTSGHVETAAMHIPGKGAKGGRFHLQLVAAANLNGYAEAIWFRSIPNTDMLQSILANQDPNFISLQFRACGEMLGIVDRGSPDQSVSWIDLSPFDYDEFGFRRAYVHLKLVREDEELWAEMDAAMFSLAAAVGGNETEYLVDGSWRKDYPKDRQGKLNIENPSGPRDALGTTYHESGTLWSGSTAADSVTNDAGQFHHVTNGWCVDQAVFPVVGSANPVLTGMVFARRTAETIAVLGKSNPAGFDSLFNFSSDVQLLPDGWSHFGNGSFIRFGEVLETESGIGLLVYTKEEFTNFVLKLEWRAMRLDNNSGVYVRIPNANLINFDLLLKSGYEIQIDNRGNRPGDASSFPEENFNPYHQTGAIYPVHSETSLPSPNGMPSKPIIPTNAFGQWNDFEITVQQNRIKVLLNGSSVLTADEYVDANNAYPKGLIGLQNHFKGRRVQFRNLKIKRI